MTENFRAAVGAFVCLLAVGFVAGGVAWSRSMPPEVPPPPACIPIQFDYTTLCPEIEGFDQIVRGSATEFDVDPDVLAATVLHESACQPMAIGDSGKALGLGQVQPKWWRNRLKKESIIAKDADLLSPSHALRAMAFITAYNGSQAHGNLFDTVRRYNGDGVKAREYARGVVQKVANLKTLRGQVEQPCD